MALTGSNTYAPCPICKYRGHAGDCVACHGTGRIQQVQHTREEPTS